MTINRSPLLVDQLPSSPFAKDITAGVLAVHGAKCDVYPVGSMSALYGLQFSGSVKVGDQVTVRDINGRKLVMGYGGATATVASGAGGSTVINNFTGGGVGTLFPSDYPAALLTDGSRSLTGNLIVSSGILIDGYDISVLGTTLAGLGGASYLTVVAEASLSGERTLIPGNLLAFTDNGAGVSYALSVDSSKLTITAGKIDKQGAGTLTLTSGSAINATFPSVSGSVAFGAGSLSISSTNDVTTAVHTHAITASNAPGAAAAILSSAPTTGKLTLAAFEVTNLAFASGASSGWQFDDRSTLTAGTRWALYSAGGQARLAQNGADKWYVDGNGYSNQTRVGAGVAAVNFPLHAELGTTQMRLQYTGGGANADFTVDSGGNLVIAPTGDFRFNPGGKDVHPVNNYDLNLGLLNKKWLTIHAAELWVETLVAQNTIATIGGRVMIGPTTQLALDLAAGATTIAVKYNNLQSGDIVYMEANGFVEFMAVTSTYTKVSNYFTYTVTRNLDGTGSNSWSAGDAIFNTGQTGRGFIDLYSYWSFKALPMFAVYNFDSALNQFSQDYSDVQVFQPFGDNANTQVNDAFYMGCFSTFTTATFYIGTGASYSATLVWEFWNGTSWASFTPSFVNPWSFGGVQTTSWSSPGGWAQTAVNGVTLFWIRVRISAFTSWTTLPATTSPISRGQRQFGPTIVGNVRNSSTFNDWGERWAMGNLNGLYTYGSDTYGFAAGKPTNSWVAADDTNGFRIMNNTTTISQWNTVGDLIIGRVANNFGRVELNASNGTVKLVNRSSTGVDTTAITLLSTPDATGAVATFNGVIGLTASTGGIYQGTGSFNTPTSGAGLRIWNSGGVGLVEGWSGGSLQWYTNTSGKLLAGGGTVILDSTGVSIGAGVGSAGTVNSLTFRSPSSGYFAINAQETGSVASMYMGNLAVAANGANTTIETYTPSALNSKIVLFAHNNASSATLTVDQFGVQTATLSITGTATIATANVTSATITTLTVTSAAWVNTYINVGGTTGTTTGAVYCNGWFRSVGNTGWYNETYGGGMYMIDSTYVRVYNGKTFAAGSGGIFTEAPTAVSLQNSWGNYGGGGWGNATYRKASDGLVIVTGLIKNGTAASGTVVGIIGYAPATRKMFTAQHGGGSVRMDIDTSGNIVILGAVTNTYLSLDCCFYTD